MSRLQLHVAFVPSVPEFAMDLSRCYLWFLAIAAVVPASAFAHPVSLSDATIDVRRKGTSVEIQVLVEELTLHYEISSDGEGVFPAKDLKQHAKSHADFLKRDLLLLDGEGRRLKCTATKIDTAAIPDAGVSQTQLKNLTVKYRMQFESIGETGFMTISQTFGGPKAILPSIMDCLVLQSGVLAEAPAQLLSKQSLTVNIDWDAPPTPPKNWKELRQRREKQLAERLGIASYGGLYSFIYVTPHEIRHEVLIPLLTLESWMPLKRRDPDFLEVSEQQAARKQIEAFFTERNPVLLNGQPVRAIVDRVNFFGLDIRDFAVNGKPRKVGVHQARVGIILSYHLPRKAGSPVGLRSVKLTWQTFGIHAEFLRSIVYIHDDDPAEHFLRPDNPTYEWKAEQNAPAVSVPPVVAGKTKLSQINAEKVSTELLQNIYRAFEYRDEEATYDALATSVDGRLLRTLYLQVRKSLLVAEQGNARSRVREVKPVRSRLLTSTPQKLELNLTWQTSGQVEHWGHIHSRENEYRARLSLAARDGAWKLVECRFLGQKRLRFQTKLRTKKLP